MRMTNFFFPPFFRRTRDGRPRHDCVESECSQYTSNIIALLIKKPSAHATSVMNALGFLSWILSGSLANRQGVQCDVKAYVQPDTQDEFTYQYRGPWQWTWCFNTDPDYVITLNCLEVKMMKFTGFCRDTLNVTTTGNIRGSQVFCDPFQVQSGSVNMKLFSLDGSGNLKCRIKSTPADECRCGYSGDLGMRIVGGTASRPHEFTSMAAILDARSREWTCGATLIHERLAVTAAHCVVDGNNEVINARNFGLIVGAHRKSQSSPSLYLYRIKRFVPHPLFSGGASLSGDIALIETEITMWFDRNVGPACLPYKFSNYLYYERVIIAGWGHIEFGGPESDVLRKGTVTIQEPSLCENIPAYHESYDRNSMICTYQDGVDSCQQDSGGPVYYRDPRTGMLFLVAITASGINCGSQHPSVNSRAYSYINWIESTYPSAKFCKIA